MRTRRNQTAAMKQATAAIIVALVIAVREAYITGSRGFYVIALLLLILPAIVFALPDNDTHDKFPSSKMEES